HELRVNQIELDMQNEELRRVQLDLEASRKKYFDLFHLAPVGYLTVNERGVLEDANLTAALLLGVERQDLVGQHMSAFIFGQDQDVWYRLERLLEQTSQPQTVEVRMRRVPGATKDDSATDAASASDRFWAQLRVRPQADSNGSGKTMPFWVTFNDVAERVAAQEATRRGERERQDALQLFDSLFHGAPLSIAVSRLPEGIFSDVNNAFLNTLGYSRNEVIGKTAEALDLFIDPGDQREIAVDLDSRNHFIDRELRFRCRDGAIRDGLLSRDIVESQGNQYSVMIVVDLTEHKQAEERILEHHRELQRLNEELVAKAAALEEANAKINRIAGTDDLTGLANRRRFYETLEKAVSLARRHDSPLALVSLDLDGLKQVNDSAGHQAGDTVLASCSARLPLPRRGPGGPPRRRRVRPAAA
ncbi:MAG TPA: PAS domain S-box protein, partial [Thermoleophilia bacterium]|nr:PAS domain S-box protein [Thermoleophilia bacterium]